MAVTTPCSNCSSSAVHSASQATVAAARDEAKGIVLRIVPDGDPVNPREWDNLGTMVCWHRRYQLGDPNPFRKPRNFLEGLAVEFGMDERRAERIRDDELLDYIERHAIVLPLYLYDHSGLAMATGTQAFRAIDPVGWDWGQVGWIYASKARVRQEYNAKKVTKRIRQRVIQVLQGEVECYGQYLAGEVYGYVVEREVACPACGQMRTELVDCCFGFYGDDPRKNGMKEQLEEEYHPLLEVLE